MTSVVTPPQAEGVGALRDVTPPPGRPKEPEASQYLAVPPRTTIEMVITTSLILWLVTGFVLMALEIW